MKTRIIWRIIDKYILIALIFVLFLLNTIIKLVKLNKTLINKDIKKILVIKLSALGDTILLIPILRAIRIKFPEARITMIATNMNAGVVENCPYLNEIKVLDINKQIKNPFSFLKFIQALRKEEFDIIFDFEQRIRLSALMAYFINAKRSFGFKTKGYLRHYLYSDVVSHRRDKHEFDCYRDLVKGIIGEVTDTKLEFWGTDKDNDWAKDFLKDVLGKKKIVVIHPGCGGNLSKGGKAKEWPKEYYIELINALAVDNLRFIISGGASEVSLAMDIVDKLKNKPIVIAGKTNVPQLAAILKLSNLLISGDSGIMHLAAALGVDTIALFGSTDYKKWRPLSEKVNIINADLDCSPCQYFGIDDPVCNDFRCMRTIMPDEVIKVASRILHR